MYKKRHKYSLSALFILLKKSYFELIKNDPLRMAGASAFFTMFALPPILIILIQVLGLIFDARYLSHQLFRNLAGVIGKESMQQVIITLLGIRRLAHNWYITIAGFLFLVFVATTLLMIIKHSINQVWKIRVIKKISFWSNLRIRFESFILIIISGVLFVAGLIAEGAQSFVGNNILHLSSEQSYYYSYILNHIITLVTVTLWFAVLFRYLPDGRPSWKVSLTGGLLTSILFNTGEFILHSLLISSRIDIVYRASGSIVLLLLFVFYTSLILYYCAAFTKLLGEYLETPIRPLSFASYYKLSEVSEHNS